MKDGFDSVKLLGQAVRKEGDLLIVGNSPVNTVLDEVGNQSLIWSSRS